MARVLLIGATGMLGSALQRVLSREAGGRHEVTVLTRDAFDIRSARWRDIPLARHGWVVNAAGLINRREVPEGDFWLVNAVFPHVLAGLCAEAGAKLVHISTDCVFDGRNAPFYEDSDALSGDLYGRTKRLGEPPSAMTLRTSIIGPEVANFYNLLCWALRQERMNGFTNHRWNGMTTLELARCVDQIIARGDFTTGVRHLHGEDVTKADLLRLICKSYGLSAKIEPCEATEARDTRLRTRFPAFLSSLAIPPLAEQIAMLAHVTSANGTWTTLSRSTFP